MWIIGVAFLVASGCDHEKYEIEMTPRGDGMDRAITGWNNDTTPRQQGRGDTLSIMPSQETLNQQALRPMAA
jgi:hypothetical protein